MASVLKGAHLARPLSSVRTVLRAQTLVCLADALILIYFYYLISSAVAPFLIRGEAVLYQNLYRAALIATGRLVLGLINAFLIAKISKTLEHGLRVSLIDEVIREGVFSKSYQSSLPYLITDAVDSIVPYYTVYLKAKRQAIALPLVIWCAVLWVSPMSALVLAVIAPLVPLFMIFIGKFTKKVSDRQLNTLTRLSERFYQAVLNLPLIKLYNLQEQQAMIIKRSGKRWRVQTLQILYAAFLSAAALEFFSTVGIALCAILLGFAIYRQGFDYQISLFVLLCVPEFFLPLRQLGSYYHQKQKALSAAAKLDELFFKESSDDQKAAPAGSSAKGEAQAEASASPKENGKAQACRPREGQGESCRQEESLKAGPDQKPLSYEETLGYLQKHPVNTLDFVVSDLCVSYPDGTAGLKHFSCVIKGGCITGLKGPSGCGKTTLLMTLLQELKPKAGSVKLGNVDLFSLNNEAYLENLSFIAQSPRLFYGTVRSNLSLGRELSDEKIEEALEKAGAVNLISDLKDGLDERVGDHNRLISGGQVRQIALARALLKEAPLIVMDEPSASLDEESELRLLRSLKEHGRGLTIILTSQREKALSLCDEVIDCARVR